MTDDVSSDNGSYNSEAGRFWTILAPVSALQIVVVLMLGHGYVKLGQEMKNVVGDFPEAYRGMTLQKASTSFLIWREEVLCQGN